MDDSEILNEKNYLVYTARHYLVNQYYTDDEYLEDINRIKYIKKLITRYIENEDLKERLILNHIITLLNCFGSEVLNKILYLKLKPQMKQIKPFLVFLNILSDKIVNVGGEGIVYTDSIPMDTEIINKLRKI